MVLMSKKKAAALASVERDRHLLSDNSAASRVAECERSPEKAERFGKSDDFKRFQDNAGKRY